MAASKRAGTLSTTHKSHDMVKVFLDKLISLAQEEYRLELSGGCVACVMYFAN